VIPPELFSLELLDQPDTKTRRAAHLFLMERIFLARAYPGNRLPFCDSSRGSPGPAPCPTTGSLFRADCYARVMDVRVQQSGWEPSVRAVRNIRAARAPAPNYQVSHDPGGN
jgi:hypothetical protein